MEGTAWSFDAFLGVIDHLQRPQLSVLAQDLADLGEDISAIAACLEADGRDVWEEDFTGNWHAWIEEHWPRGEAEQLERELAGAERSLSWVGEHRARLRERDRAELARLAGLARFDLSEEEVAPLLKDRVCGIRGRYRLTGMTWEQRHGITQADVDAP